MRQPTRKHHRTGAFSFIEILVAITVLGLAVTVLFVTFHSGALEGKISEDRLKAMTLAQRELEQVKQIAALGRGSLEQFFGDPDKQVKRYVVDELYTVLTTVDPRKKVTVGSSTAEVGEATVTVSWFRPGRGEEHVQLAALIDQAYY